MAEHIFYADVAVMGALTIDDNKAEFPANPRMGMMVMKDNVLFGYMKIGNYETWYPLSRHTNYYIHAQGLESQVWEIKHEMQTHDIWFQVKDSTGRMQNPADVEIVDDSTIKLYFAFPVKGSAFLVGPSSISVPKVTATSLSISESIVLGTIATMTIGNTVVLSKDGVIVGNKKLLDGVTINDGLMDRFTVGAAEKLKLVAGDNIKLVYDSAAKSVTISVDVTKIATV